MPPQQQQQSDQPTGNEQLSNVDDLPFSLLSKLFYDLRNAHSKRTRDGMSNNTVKFRNNRYVREQYEARYTVLTRTWLQISQRLNNNNNTTTHQRQQNDEVTIIPAHLISPESSFKLISLIIPELDSAHAYLGMKETKLADAFIKALDLPISGEKAQWLKHYKERIYRPIQWRNDSSIIEGDFSTILRAVLSDRCNQQQQQQQNHHHLLTIGDVWNVLDILSQTTKIRNRRIMKMNYHNHSKNDESGFKSSLNEEERKCQALITLVEKGTADQVADVVRIILKDLNMRLSRDNFLNWFHPSAKQHFTQIHDVHRMLKDCHDPTFNIGDAAVQIGQYASVMLTMRPTRKNLPTICENLCGHGENSHNSTGTSSSKDDMNINHNNDGEKEKSYFIMEPKLDGERLQLHKWKEIKEKKKKNNIEKNKEIDDDQSNIDNDSDHRDDGDVQVRTFSRRGNDSSAMYADALYDVVMNGIRARDVILDGEITIWDDLKECWVRFEDMREITTAIARQSVPDGTSYTLKYMVFDVLYVAQQQQQQHQNKAANMVMRLPLYKRRELIEKLIPSPVEHCYGRGIKCVIQVIQMEKGYNEKDLTNGLQRYETLGYEGVVAKHPNRPYVLAERNLDLAVKLKPDYFDGGIQDIDVLILGAKYSASRGHRIQRTGKLSSFLIGVLVNDQEDEEKWIPIGCVGTGYSDMDLKEIQDHLDGEWRDLDIYNLPDHFDKKRSYVSESTVLTDVKKWVQPRKSIVLTVRAFELNRKFNMLRFARVERIRWDKAYNEVTHIGHLRDLDEHKQAAFIRGDEDDDDDVGGESTIDVFGNNKKRRKQRGGDGILDSEEETALQIAREEGHEIRSGRRGGRAVIGDITMSGNSRSKRNDGTSIEDIEIENDIFQNLLFVVVVNEHEHKRNRKEELEEMIHRCGGKFVHSINGNVDFMICEDRTLSRVQRTREMMRNQENTDKKRWKMSIVHSDWIEECVKRESKIELKIEWVIEASETVRKTVYKDCDRFGDGWENETDLIGFQKSIEKAIEEAEFLDSSNLSNNTMKKKEDLFCADDDEEMIDILNKCQRDCGDQMFANVVMCIDTSRTSYDDVIGYVALVKAFGGRVIDEMSDEVTHLFSPKFNDDKNVAGMKRMTMEMMLKMYMKPIN